MHVTPIASASPDGTFRVDPVFLPSEDSADPGYCIEIDPCDICGGHACDVFSCRTFEDDRHPLERDPTIVSFGRTAKERYSACGYENCTCKTRESRSHELHKSHLRLERRGR